MLKRLVLVLALVMPPIVLAEETLQEAAEKEKARRAKQKGTPAKVYTNEDLPDAEKDAKKDAKKTKGKATPTPTPGARVVSPEPLAEEASWKSRAAACRSAIQVAEAELASRNEALAKLTTDTLASTDTTGIFRLKAEQERMRAEIQQAEERLQAAKRALEQLEEEARHKSIPPGWLR